MKKKRALIIFMPMYKHLSSYIHVAHFMGYNRRKWKEWFKQVGTVPSCFNVKE